MFNVKSTNVSVTTNYANPMNDFEVAEPPSDSISSLAFSPATVQKNFLIAGSWDNNVRCWEIEQSGTSVPKSMQAGTDPVLDVAWSDDGAKVFIAGCDKQARMWDLASNQVVQVAQHDAPIKTCHWIKGSNYSCLMTGSWDKTLKFWDTRSPNAILNMDLLSPCYCADVDFPMAVVGTADKKVFVYNLEGQPQEYKKMDSALKFQTRCIAIFRDKNNAPTGYGLGSVEGRVAIQYVDPVNPKDNFTFKCHRSVYVPGSPQDIYAVNDIAFHPVHGTLATVGSNGTFNFWDKDARTKLKTSEVMQQSITTCAFNHDGQIFAYSVSYDWSKGHKHNNPQLKNYIFLRPCIDELKPKS